MSKTEALNKMKQARSWRELGMSVAEAYEALSTDDASENSAEVLELRAKVEQLTETNKRLRAENKALKAGA